MKRITVAALALLLVLGLSVGLLGDTDFGSEEATLSPKVTFSVNNFYAIYIPSGDMSVDLGTITGSCYNIVDNTWCVISDGEAHKVWAFTNNTAGLKVTVSATSTGTPTIDSLADLHIKGGEITSFDDGHLDSTVTLKTTDAAGIVKIEDVEYEYQADANDTPGEYYQATLTYTATTN